MSAVTVHTFPAGLPAPAGRPASGTITVAPDSRTEIRLVDPADVPEGAVVLGLVVAVPSTAPAPPIAPAAQVPARQLVAVPSAEAAPPADGLLECRPGLVLDRWGRHVLADGVELTLTRREFELLEYLVVHPGRVFTRDQLMAAVWDVLDTRYAPARTVDVHVSRLRRKLGPAHADSLQSLRGVGYRWSGRTQPSASAP